MSPPTSLSIQSPTANVVAHLSQDQVAKDKALASLTPAQIASLHNIQNSGKAALAHAASAVGHPGSGGHHPSHVATAAAGLAALGLAAPSSVTPYPPFWQPIGPSSAEDVKPFNGSSSSQVGGGVHQTGVLSNSNQNANSVAALNNNNNNNGAPAWEGRSIASHKLRLTEFTAFMEGPGGAVQDKHIFVQIGGPGAMPNYSDPLLEDIDVRQISDKFPANKGGLKELYDKGPANAFFLVKFWVSFHFLCVIGEK